MMGPILDGIAEHMKNYPEDRRFIPADKKPVDVAKVLKETGAEILVNFVPVGAENAARFYAEECLKAGVSFVNCMPVFIVSDPKFAERFKKEGIPVAGDDIKSQLGATILHRAIVNLFRMRGIFLEQTYQLNFGGNTDFLNMLDRQRLKTKKISKTQAVASISGQEIPEDKIHIGPSDYVPFLNDTKICYIRVEGKGFGGAPILIDVKLQVEDSPNSAGVVTDVIRLIKVAREEGIGGPIYSVSAFTMKHPPMQMTDEEAYKIIQDYLEGKGKLW
jgi:myo-inositol-1-phosphate synthase